MASVRARALAGDKLIGALLRMPSEELVEMLAVAEFDFVLIDCEHGPADLVALRQHIALAQVHGVPVIVRVGEGDRGQILRVLDQGAEGILAPHLDTAADAAALVDAAMYPPVGNRGFATYSRAGRFGLVAPPDHRDWWLEHTLVLGMIESPGGVANVDSIVSTTRLDGIMVGPADLAASSGPDDQPVPEAITAVHSALARAGSLRMDIVGTRDAASAAFSDGADLVVYNLASSLMAHLRGLAAPER
ncbi:4-hydroxy-2-oxoheptanedioate aldolase [Microbacterium phyllosphaerae]|uniref:4-hydroxy-2-oxoheptanedioate aldolase n=1 Tax=Microbacterium phyllosphaerae TaxID=124798 RepID=A0ABS4WMB2_9MICO|nr:aldolase/citrate lyase family protein [Microbacterium phyllosphaerae]MBP2377335.1 4-hydroxy-2-oxoheptanedioate aldolase [Microbacterium phyllosphaerae]